MNTGGKQFREMMSPTRLRNFFQFRFKSGSGNLTSTIPRVTLVLESKTRPGLPAGFIESKNARDDVYIGLGLPTKKRGGSFVGANQHNSAITRFTREERGRGFAVAGDWRWVRFTHEKAWRSLYGGSPIESFDARASTESHQTRWPGQNLVQLSNSEAATDYDAAGRGPQPASCSTVKSPPRGRQPLNAHLGSVLVTMRT